MAATDPTRRKYDEACEVMLQIQKSGFKAMFNGGCVRDRILNIEPTDFDIASNALPTDIQTIFKGTKFRVIDTGIDHGTVTVVGKFSSTEVTTLRKDVDTDGRKAVVQFGDSFEEDSERRDFTINAMFADMDGNILDFHEGLSDLAAKRLRFVGDPDARIKEDFLRILRLFRFHSRFGFSIDSSTIAAVTINAPGLKRVSQERITSELWKILEGSFVESALTLMIASNVFSHVFQTFDQPDSSLVKELAKITHKQLEKNTIAEIRFAFLLSSLTIHSQKVELREILSFLKSLRLSSKEVHKISGFFELIRISIFASQDQTMEFLDHLESREIPLTHLHEISDSLGNLGRNFQPLIECELKFGYLRKSKIPISGSYLMEQFKIEPGRLLGDTLDYLKRSFRREEWKTVSEGLIIARQFLESHR
jgi:tRNA nucleotidyltransferase/poly(A) polymerase